MALQRCLDCNATVKPDETICWACGSAVKRNGMPVSMSHRFASAINFLFIVSIVVTVASMFTDMVPPFGRCATVTLVLLLVKSSAGQMMEKERG